jgi:protein-disulfide isomerase
MEPRKLLVSLTAFFALAFFTGAVYYESVQMPAPLVLKTEGFPSEGNPKAWVEIAIFEDFLCHNCRTFNEEIYLKLKKEYIDTGKARYTMIPLAFMKGSKPIANAALAVFHSAPHRFFAYAEALFHFPETQKVTPTALLEIAQKVGGIDLAYLQKAITERKFYGQLRENLEWAKETLGNNFRTPALYINGIPTSTSSFELIEMRMEHILTIGKIPQ